MISRSIPLGSRDIRNNQGLIIPHLHLFTWSVTFVPRLCDHKTGQVVVEATKEAERLPWSFKGGTKDVQTSPRTPRSPCSKQSHKVRRGSRSLTGHSKETGGRHTQNGCAGVGHWSPRKKCVLCVSIWAMLLPSLCCHCASFGRPIASTERSLWRPHCLKSATTETLAMVLPPLCLLCATCCATTAFSMVQGTHKGRAAAVTQKQNFLGIGRQMSFLANFLVAQRWHEVATLCKGYWWHM